MSETRPHPAAEILSTGIQRRKALLLATVFPVRYPVSGKAGHRLPVFPKGRNTDWATDTFLRKIAV